MKLVMNAYKKKLKWPKPEVKGSFTNVNNSIGALRWKEVYYISL